MVAILGMTVAAAACSSSFFQGKEKFLEKERQTTAEAEMEIRKSAALKELDILCRQVPIPKEFSFISKHVNDNNTISLNYDAELSFYIASNFYLNYFETHGWKTGVVESPILHSVTGIKDDNRISIAYGGIGTGEIDYSITCAKL
jgi:hypothetical protein